MDKIKIIIADDHPVFRGGLNWAISKDSSIEIIAGSRGWKRSFRAN